MVQSESHSRTEYINFEPSQHTYNNKQTRRFSYRQSRYFYKKNNFFDRYGIGSAPHCYLKQSNREQDVPSIAIFS